jgi:SNW domain-containing protein 1
MSQDEFGGGGAYPGCPVAQYREALPGPFADDDSYNLYDRPLFLGSNAAAAVCKARGNLDAGNDSKPGSDSKCLLHQA